MTKFKTLQFTIPGDDTIIYALVLEDELSEYGLIIGGPSEIRQAITSLSDLLKSGQADEETDHLDERLGTHWLSVNEAAREYGIAISTVRYAAQSGHIHRAEKQNGQWRFPARTFRYWLQNRPRPGPKTRERIKKMFNKTVADYQMFDDPFGEMASDRVTVEPALQPYRDILIDYDWDESDHLEWVATAELSEIVDWAENIRKHE